MPDGKVHAITTLAATSATAIGMVYSSKFDAISIVITCAGCLTTLWINPDLDLNRPFQKDNPKSWLFWTYSWPYSRILSHRSFFSHFPIISTLIRVLYFGCPIILLVWKSNYTIAEDTVFLYVTGMIICDVLHWLLDTITTKIKRARA